MSRSVQSGGQAMNQDNSEQPFSLSEEDLALVKELKAVREQRQRLYEKLDSPLKALFSYCEWRITCYKNNLAELVVVCPSFVIYKRLHKRSETIHNRFQKTVEVKHTRFQLSFPKSRKAFYEHEISQGD
jgi:hypothetical protein